MARVETPSPLSFFDKADGLRRRDRAAIRHDGRLYLAMQTGIHYLDPASGRPGAPPHPRQSARSSQPVLGLAADAGSRVAPARRCSPRATKACTKSRAPGRRPSRRSKICVPFLRPAGLAGRSVAGLDRAVRRPRLVPVERRPLDGRRQRGRCHRTRAIALRECRRLAVGGHQNDGVLRVRFASPPAPAAPRPAARIERFGPPRAFRPAA